MSTISNIIKTTKMHQAKCFICDERTIIYCENVHTIRSCHTDTPVMDILRRFANELDMTTTIWKTSTTGKCVKTIVCQMCMIKINEYDLACMTAKDMERQLKVLLQRKDEYDDDKSSDVDYNPDVGSSNDDDDEEERNCTAEPKGMEVTVMRCNVCQINFKSYRELTSHTHQPKKINGLIIKKINKNGRSRIIEHFNDISTSTAIDRTKIFKRPDKPKKMKKRNFSCDQCEAAYYKRQELREHIKESHTLEDKNRCPICRGLYLDKDVLEKHIPLHEGKHRLQCVECNTVFTRSNGLMRHMSIHTGEKFHICDTCGKEFIYQSSYRRHLLVHGNIRNHCCPVCDKSFVQTTHLKVHMRSHSKEKPYKCPICDKDKYE